MSLATDSNRGSHLLDHKEEIEKYVSLKFHWMKASVILGPILMLIAGCRCDPL